MRAHFWQVGCLPAQGWRLDRALKKGARHAGWHAASEERGQQLESGEIGLAWTGTSPGQRTGAKQRSFCRKRRGTGTKTALFVLFAPRRSLGRQGHNMRRTGDASSRRRRWRVQVSDGAPYRLRSTQISRTSAWRRVEKGDARRKPCQWNGGGRKARAPTGAVPLGAGQKCSMAHAMRIERRTCVKWQAGASGRWSLCQVGCCMSV